MNKGLLLTLEGIDGCGKSTQAASLASHLTEEGFHVVLTKEPGGTDVGIEIRKMMFKKFNTLQFAPGVVDALFLADHLQHVNKVVRPAMLEGSIVISDRYADSNLAYCKARPNTPLQIEKVYRELFLIVPDLTILLTGSPNVLSQRAKVIEGKSWRDPRDLGKAQLAYQSNLSNSPRVKQLAMADNDDANKVFEGIKNILVGFLNSPEVGRKEIRRWGKTDWRANDYAKNVHSVGRTQSSTL